MSTPEPAPIEFNRVIWRDEDLAQPGDPHLSAEILNRREILFEQLVAKVNDTLGMVSQVVFNAAIENRFPLLPELTPQPLTNPVSNKADLLGHTTRFNITSTKTQELPTCAEGAILAISVTNESNATLTVTAAGTDRIGYSATVTKDMKPSDYMILRGRIINGVGRWARLSGPLLSETDNRYTLPGDTGFTQSDADEIYEKLGVAQDLVEQITKTSLGLGNVQNYSPENMPLSIATIEAIDEALLAPPKNYTATNISGNFRPDYNDGTLQRYKTVQNCKLLPPANPQPFSSMRFELYSDTPFGNKFDIDPEISNVSLVPFPYDMQSNKSVIVVMAYSEWGNRWMLLSLIPEP